MKRFESLNTKAAILFFLASIPLVAQAQVGGALDLSADTDSPAPGQTVTITAQSYSTDINSAHIVWTAGGKSLGSGYGLTKVTVQAPAAGKRLTVNISVDAPDGTSLTGSIAITSGSIDMVIEPQGYVPPFFRGKVAVAYQNSTKIVAVPHLANSAGVEYDPRSLVYKWEQNGSVLQEQSGYGRQSILIQGGIVPRPAPVSVTVTTRDGTVSGTGFTVLGAEAPSVLFYKNDPLYGPLFNLAIATKLFLGSQKETGVLAVPYSFTSTPSSDNLSYSWIINGSLHKELSSNRSITLRAPDAESGTSDISLTINNPKNILQQAQAGFSTVWSSN